MAADRAAGAGTADAHARLGIGLMCPESSLWSSPSSKGVVTRGLLAVEPRLLALEPRLVGGREPLSELACMSAQATATGAGGCAAAAGVARGESASPGAGAGVATESELGSAWVPGGCS